MTYCNSTKIAMSENEIHHNSIGISTGFLKSVLIQGNRIFSNMSWGIFLRNSQVTVIDGNEVHRNYCGGIRVVLNRFDNTFIKSNIIHDHTGPDMIQTRFMNEINTAKRSCWTTTLTTMSQFMEVLTKLYRLVDQHATTVGEME